MHVQGPTKNMKKPIRKLHKKDKKKQHAPQNQRRKNMIDNI
jgi:hypothetical protein